MTSVWDERAQYPQNMPGCDFFFLDYWLTWVADQEDISHEAPAVEVKPSIYSSFQWSLLSR